MWAGPGYPAATEFFRSVVADVKEAGTGTLLIDLRENHAGTELIEDTLIYFLYGKEALVSNKIRPLAAGGGWVRKYSEYWFDAHPTESLEKINEGRRVPLAENDNDFSGDFTDDVARFEALLQQIQDPAAYLGQECRAMSPTFYAEYESGAYEAYYRPENVLVLSDARTFSAGFSVLRALYWAGATVVGTPSGQASDSFGFGEFWRLNHTGIQGLLSSGYTVSFPDDSDMGEVPRPHHPLTYEKLVEYDFDANATVLYALDLVSDREGL